MNNQRQSKIALLINMISPARIPLYAGLAASFDLLILHGGTERNRDSWRDVHAMLPGAKIVKAWGWLPTPGFNDLGPRQHGVDIAPRFAVAFAPAVKNEKIE